MGAIRCCTQFLRVVILPIDIRRIKIITGQSRAKQRDHYHLFIEAIPPEIDYNRDGGVKINGRCNISE